jgi:hypothetical protein
VEGVGCRAQRFGDGEWSEKRVVQWCAEQWCASTEVVKRERCSVG